MDITHAKVSEKSDGGDSSLVLSSDWNDLHVISSGVILPLVTTYSSNVLDGVFSWLGCQDTLSFRNPATIATPLVTVFGDGSAAYPGFPQFTGYTATQSSSIDGTRTADKATDRSLDPSSGCTHTYDSGDSWWKADFGAGRTFEPTHMALIGRWSGGQHPRNFKLQGSTDDSSWDDLLTVSADGPGDNSWWHSAVSGASDYRYIRILQTGLNYSGSLYLVLGEVELWGTLT